MRILLLEDDYSYRQSVKEYLQSLSYEVDEAEDGEVACEKITKNSYHLLILDIKVPEISGHEVITYARNIGVKTPIMIMTSLIDIDNLAISYELGCNEYLKKPFNLMELKFRVNELMKKYYGKDEKNTIKIATDFEFNLEKKELKLKDKVIVFSQKELNLIEYLLINRGNFVSIEKIIDDVWQNSIDNTDVRMHVRKIRMKTSQEFILSSRGFGYKINV